MYPQDPGMQYDPNAYQMPQMAAPDFQSMQAPQMDYSNYMQNNYSVMQSGQSNLSQAFQTAQYNFHQQMQVAMQGAMSSAMAIHNSGKTVQAKAAEHIYNDALLNTNGNYVLERSRFRDVMWATGIAGSGLGRELQIGGRRQEFLSDQEMRHQMRRSMHHGMGEMGDALISGGSNLVGGAAGLMVGGGLLSGLAASIAIPAMVFDPIARYTLDQRRAKREMNAFTEMADLNYGTGQRRMSEDKASELGHRFWDYDTSAARYIPGGSLVASRFESTNKALDTFKKMAKMDMFRELNVDDVDAIEQKVQKTMKVIDRMAGLMNTTRDAILQMKGRMQSMGIHDDAQNDALGKMASFRFGTGYSAQATESLFLGFNQLGRQMGLYSEQNKISQGLAGLNEVASIKAMQEAGLIGRNADPGTLAQQRYMNAANQMNSGWGKVVERGNGIPMHAASYYANRGGGSVVLGMEMDNLTMFGHSTNPYEQYQKNSDMTYGALRKMGMSHQDTQAFLLKRETTPEGKQQAFEAYSGLGFLGKMEAYQSEKIGALNKVGDGSLSGSRLKLKDLLIGLPAWSQSGYNSQDAGYYRRLSNSKRAFADIQTASTISRDGSKEDFKMYQSLKKQMGDEFLEVYHGMDDYADDVKSFGTSRESREGLLQKIMSNDEFRRSLTNEEAADEKKSRAKAMQVLNTSNAELEAKHHRYENDIKNFKQPKSALAFIAGSAEREGKFKNREYNTANRIQSGIKFKDNEQAMEVARMMENNINNPYAIVGELHKKGVIDTKTMRLMQLHDERLGAKEYSNILGQAVAAGDMTENEAEAYRIGHNQLGGNDANGHFKDSALIAMGRAIKQKTGLSAESALKAQEANAHYEGLVNTNTSVRETLQRRAKARYNDFDSRKDQDKILRDEYGLATKDLLETSSSLLKSGKLNWKQDGQKFIESLTTVSGLDEDIAKKLARTMASSPEHAQQIMQRLGDLNLHALTNEDKDKIKDMAAGVVSPEQEAIKKFTDVLDKIHGALTANG